MRRRAWVLGTIFVGVAAIAVVVLRPPGPAPLPPGATAIFIETQPWRPWPPQGLGCPAALLPSVRIVFEDGAIAYQDVESGVRRSVIWPPGFSARRIGGLVEIVTGDGRVFAREGAVVSGLEGGTDDAGRALVCLSSAYTPSVDPPP